MPRIARNRPTSRLNLEIQASIRERMEKLMEETEAYSLTEVIRRALAVYDVLWEEKRKGGTTIIRNGTGEKELILI